MPNASSGPVLRGRVRSRLSDAVSRIGWLTPEHVLGPFSYAAAPGTGGAFLWVAPRAAKIVRVDYVADTNGAGGSKVYLRKHLAAQTAAANAATSGANIVDLVTDGIAADSTVRAATIPSLVTAAATFAVGDKLTIVPPANWIGCVTLYVIFL